MDEDGLRELAGRIVEAHTVLVGNPNPAAGRRKMVFAIAARLSGLQEAFMLVTGLPDNYPHDRLIEKAEEVVRGTWFPGVSVCEGLVHEA